MGIKVVMTARVLSKKEIEKYEHELGVEFVTAPCQSEAEIISAARDADAIITLLQPFSARVIERLDKCKLIFNAGTGFDTIDVAAATARGIRVAYAGDYCMEEVSDHAVALMLACARKITRLDRAVRAGAWSSFEKRDIRNKILPLVFRIRGQTVGIIGLGRIGRLTASKLKGLGVDLVGFDPYLPAETFVELQVRPVQLPELLRVSDYVIIQASLGPGSNHLVGPNELKMMKPAAYLINVARGAFVDQKALYQALAGGAIAGAALDVVEEEPAGIGADHPLLSLDNVIVTAHSAYYSEQSSETYKRRIFEAVAAVAQGRAPEWTVNPEAEARFKARWGPSKKDA